MVSLRRRRNLGLSAGKSLVGADLRPTDNIKIAEDVNQNVNHVSDHSLPEKSDAEAPERPSKSWHMIGLGPVKVESFNYYPGKEVKRRKRHRRRKHYEDQEPCVMRGVYFKNAKWQAAIKVDKKQIHLGTVGSQEEAAHLYDRAAFMCGREPNFELSEEAKQELKRYTWEEFLTITRTSITVKRQRRVDAGSRRGMEAEMKKS